MTILAYIEHHGRAITKGGRVLVQAALTAKKTQGYTKCIGVLCGSDGAEEAAKDAAQYGLDEVVYVKSPALEHYLATTYAQVFQKLDTELQPKLVIALASTTGKDLFPRVAQQMGAGQASDCVGILPGGHYRRPMYAGNVFAEVEITTDRKVVTIRSTAFEPANAVGGSCPVRAVEFSPVGTTNMTFVKFDTVASARPELTDADIVVSGGRALKSAENFEKVLAPLADVLGAAIGASRAAVDSGYAPNDWQVGQTGKVVAPKLYVAVGISGAIQHLAGMKDSKVIVAINKDAEAPIFEVADYGLVADLYEIVPQLTEAIRQLKKS